MGIDIEGRMIVGAHGSNLDIPDCEDLYDFCGEHGIAICALHYDAPLEDSYIGFCLPNIPVCSMGDTWVKEVRGLSERFKELTGLDASLIGTQSVW